MSKMSGGGDSFETPKREKKFVSPLMRRLEKESDIFKSPACLSPARHRTKPPLFSTPRSPSTGAKGRVKFDLSNIPLVPDAIISKLPKPKETNHSSADDVFHSCDEVCISDSGLGSYVFQFLDLLSYSRAGIPRCWTD